MALTLSSADVAQLQHATTVLLSPLAYPDVSAWRAEARAAIEPLVRADKSAFMLPLDGEPLIQMDPADDSAQRAYAEYYHRLDTGLQVRRRELGLGVSHQSMVYDMAQFRRSELYNDWGVPHRLFDAMSLNGDLAPGQPPAALVLYHATEDAEPFGERGLAILELLLPAYKAGLRSCIHLARQRADLASFVETMTAGAALFDDDYRLLHRNRALEQLLAADPEAWRICHEMASVAASTLALASPRAQRSTKAATPPGLPARELRTHSGRYRMTASMFDAATGRGVARVVILVERLTAQPLDPGALRARYGLTPRETEVARLLAHGESDASIARRLGISIHTAERHTEHILAKLGVRSRAAVAAALHGEL